MKKYSLLAEFVILYLGLPLLFPLGLLPKKPMPFIIGIAVVMTFILFKDKSFDRNNLWRKEGLKIIIKSFIKPLLISALLMIAFVYYLQPDKLFSFPLSRPILWALVMLLYPVLSVYPQEIIYRAFFYHRYKNLFVNETYLLIASAISFGLAHILFGSWISVVLSTIGGLLFANTYRKTNSLLAASVEHALYGQLIFTIGLGNYFFHRAG